MNIFKKNNEKKTTQKLPMTGKVQKGFRAYCAVIAAATLVCGMSVTAFAASDPITVVNNLSDFIFGLIRAIGLILLGFGIVQVGLSLKSHDPSQRANGFLTLAGGIIITFAKEILDNDTEALLTTARKHLCQFAVLKYQQMDGLNTAMPFGTRKIDAFRTLTTESLMYNYIIPLIGDVKLDELTPRLMDKFYQSLLKVKTKVVQNKKPKNEYLTVHTVREIHKFLRSAFNQAVKWELMTRNPVLNATLPKEEHQKREIWTAETLMHALEVCDDDILALAINLSFACSLRMGEMLGLTWDCIDISEESLKENNASIFVDKELQRVNRDVMEVLDNKDIIRVFPRTLSNTNTSLVLKTPKTKTSVRKIFLPSTVAQMLLERKKQIDEMKELFGDEYLDYDLVFCHSSGRPMEGQVINRALKKLIQDNDLPDVVFHSFRHASITYKLKWNGGDMKSVQGDSGHARMDMVADVYSHIIDEDRRYNAQKFEEQFYNAKGLKNAEEGKTAPMPKFETSVELLDPMAEVQKESEVEKEKPAENSTDENAALLTKLLSNPETAALLKALAKTI